MKEEFESARKWVEENEVCRFEGVRKKGDEEFKKFLAFTEFYLKQRNTEGVILRKTFNTSIELYDIERYDKNVDGENTLVVSYSEECRILATYTFQNNVIKSLIEEIELGNSCINDVEKFKDYSRKYFGRSFFNVYYQGSGKPILYNFEPIDNEHSYFSVIVTVKDLKVM